MTYDQADPAEALEAVRLSREALIARVEKPWRSRGLYALGVAAIPGAQVFDLPWNNLVIGVAVILMVLAYRGWIRQTGVRITGITPRRARWVALGLGAVMLVLTLGGIYLKRELGLWQAPLAIAPLGFAAGWFGSGLWMRVYRRELREGA